MKPSAIKAKWDASRQQAANLGTWMHLQFELCLNRSEVDECSAEMQLFLRYFKTLDGLPAYRTEWMIYADAERIAGTIDFVAIQADGRLVLFDWKRSKDRDRF